MADWVVEHGIGETRAARIDGDRIVEARLIPDGELIAGSIVDARLVARMPERGQGIVAWDGGEAVVAPLPPGVTQGARCRVEITRPAIPEPGKPKRARCRPAGADAEPHAGAPVLPDARVLRPGEPDLLEAAGWSDLLEEAATGAVAFPGGMLAVALTPAMTLIDVDGTLAPAALGVAGAGAAAAAIARLDIGGSIGIDLPGADKSVRTAAGEAIDLALPAPFERTAVNGFGFVQIVRPRRRRSLPEIFAMDGALAHARALLRRAERSGGAGERTIAAHPAVIAALEARPDWIAELARRMGHPSPCGRTPRSPYPAAMSKPASRNLCPLCGAAASADHAPFCGQGCRDRDLLQWLGEGYRIPGPPADPMDAAGLDRREDRD